MHPTRPVERLPLMQTLVAVEKRLPDLVSEAHATLERFAEILLVEIEGLQVSDCTDRGIAWLVGEQRHFAEDVARIEHGDLTVRRAGFLQMHARRAVHNEKELLPHVSLTDGGFARSILALLHALCDVRNLGRGKMLEKLHFL